MDGSQLSSQNGVSSLLIGGVYIGNGGCGECMIEAPRRGLPFFKRTVFVDLMCSIMKKLPCYWL